MLVFEWLHLMLSLHAKTVYLLSVTLSHATHTKIAVCTTSHSIVRL